VTDSTFQRHLNQLAAAKDRYLMELQECENEYKQRFGFFPSDIDDDYWIDAFHSSGWAASSRLSVEQVTKRAKYAVAMATEVNDE